MLEVTTVIDKNWLEDKIIELSRPHRSFWGTDKCFYELHINDISTYYSRGDREPILRAIYYDEIEELAYETRGNVIKIYVKYNLDEDVIKRGTERLDS